MARKRQLSVSELDLDLDPDDFYTAKKPKKQAPSSLTIKQNSEATPVWGRGHRASISSASSTTMLGDQGRQMPNININISPCPGFTTTVSYRGDEIFINTIPLDVSIPKLRGGENLSWACDSSYISEEESYDSQEADSQNSSDDSSECSSDDESLDSVDSDDTESHSDSDSDSTSDSESVNAQIGVSVNHSRDLKVTTQSPQFGEVESDSDSVWNPAPASRASSPISKSTSIAIPSNSDLDPMQSHIQIKQNKASTPTPETISAPMLSYSSHSFSPEPSPTPCPILIPQEPVPSLSVSPVPTTPHQTPNQMLRIPNKTRFLSLKRKLDDFLPQMEVANAALGEKSMEEQSMECLVEGAKAHIEMDLALGVLEKNGKESLEEILRKVRDPELRFPDLGEEEGKLPELVPDDGNKSNVGIEEIDDCFSD